MHRSAHELAAGSRFRGLLVQSVLGCGAMGVAHLASHSVLRMPLVIKTFAPRGGDPFREAYLAARVRSPHVVTVLDAGFEDERPFVVQEYVDGVDLAELASALDVLEGALPVTMVVRLVRDLAAGLHAIHQAGVVHRDLKPENCFLGGDGAARVGDFGIAVDPTEAPGSKAPVAGTPYFVAPEIWRGGSPSPRSDLYALGVSAHVLVTGKYPFGGNEIEEVALAHTTEPYSAPPAAEPDLAFLFALVGRMLAKDPDERPEGADQVAAELSRLSVRLPGWSVRGASEASVAGLAVSLLRGDIVTRAADVIVNAANWRLTMNVGVAAAIGAAGGEEIESQALSQAPVAMGSVVWTDAGALEARWVAHAVAAMAGSICIQRALLRVLLEARARGAETIAVPALGTGVGGVPHPLGAKLTFEAIRTFAQLGPGSVRRIEIVLYDEPAEGAWRRALAAL